ncbi:MAG: pinensin family lanthipeptide [Bacteroidota bacterium]
MKRKLKLESLKVKSFVTEDTDLNAETLKGGTGTIPILTNAGPACQIFVSQNCPTRFALICNQITQNILQCGTPPVTLQINCNQVSVNNICIVPTVVGTFC